MIFKWKSFPLPYALWFKTFNSDLLKKDEYKKEKVKKIHRALMKSILERR